VELYRRHTRVVDVLLPDVGHPATGPIAEAGLLEELAMDFIYDRLDIQHFTRRVLREHVASPHRHYVLSQRATLTRTRVAEAGEAAALAPDNFGYVSHHASLLTAAGRFEEAQAAFARAATLMPDHPVLLFKLTEFHERRGDLDRAIGLAGELVARHSQTFQPRLDQLQARQRRELGWMNVVRRVSSRLGLRHCPQPVPAETVSEPPPAARLDEPQTSWRIERADGVGASSTFSQTAASVLAAPASFGSNDLGVDTDPPQRSGRRARPLTPRFASRELGPPRRLP
jgi:tetratricopeptide (TPR) repeat protein